MLFIASLRIGSHRKACKDTAFFANTQIFLLFLVFFLVIREKSSTFAPIFLSGPVVQWIEYGFPKP